MNNSPLISIVLPTYNVAQYLQQCLESVAAQTYPNIEVIIIIDGATDGSYEIAQEFCKTDSRFTVYWQENAGSGPARNAGLSHCTGEFVMFVDPDDWIEPELLEKLYEAQQDGDYDLVASRRTTVACDKKGRTIRITQKHYKEEAIAGQQKLRYAYVRMLDMGVVGDPTQKLYKMSIISSNGVTFPALRRTQDVVFNYRYYSYIESLKLISYSGYNYRKMVQQAPTKAGEDYYKTIVYIYDDYIKMYESWNIPFPDQELCNFIFRSRIYANIQRGVDQGWNIKKILEDPTINHIITKATPKPIYLVITKQLIKHKQYIVLKYFLKIVMIFKQRILYK